MRAAAFLCCWLACFPAFAGGVTLTRAELLKIGKALKTCKARQRQHKVELDALRASFKAKLKHERKIAKATRANPLSGVLWFTLGAVSAGVVVGLVVYNVNRSTVAKGGN